MNIYDAIHHDHEEVESILKSLHERLSSPSGVSSATIQDDYAKLRSSLLRHMRAEEKMFYPIILGQYKLDGLEAMEEHHAARLILNELDEMDTTDDRWHAKMMVLKDMIEHHVQTEEGTIFKETREIIGNGKADALGDEFEQTKSKIVM